MLDLDFIFLVTLLLLSTHKSFCKAKTNVQKLKKTVLLVTCSFYIEWITNKHRIPLNKYTADALSLIHCMSLNDSIHFLYQWN